jgi:hypothetical protein
MKQDYQFPASADVPDDLSDPCRRRLGRVLHLTHG